jgi:hypothetical protein
MYTLYFHSKCKGCIEFIKDASEELAEYKVQLIDTEGWSVTDYKNKLHQLERGIPMLQLFDDGQFVACKHGEILDYFIKKSGNL